MKNIAFLIILSLGFQISYAQNFEKTKKYSVKIDAAINTQDNEPNKIRLLGSEDFSSELIAITIKDIDIEEVFISSLENPGLEGISEVIKLEVEYLGCCAHVNVYYLMVTDDKEFVTLPQLNNIYCENTNADYQYTFPNQTTGKKGEILETETFYTNTYEVKKVNLRQNIVWNNKEFDFSKEQAITTNY